MHTNVRWSTLSDDKLRQVTWTFWLYGTYLVLDSYIVEERPTARHRWKEIELYHRLSMGMRSAGRIIHEADVPLTDDIRDRVIREHTAQLRVVRWNEVQPQKRGL